MISLSITECCILSTSSEQVRSSLKNDYIEQFLKTNLEKTDINCHRPISNLSVRSIIKEREISRRLDARLEINDLYLKYQSAYRVAQSTKTTLIVVLPALVQEIGTGNITLL